MDPSLPSVSRRVFQHLHVHDAGEVDAEVTVERVGVVADVEEDFGDGLGFEDGSERFAGRGFGREGECAESVDVDEVDVVLGQDEHLEDGDAAVAAEVDAFEVEV